MESYTSYLFRVSYVVFVSSAWKNREERLKKKINVEELCVRACVSVRACVCVCVRARVFPYIPYVNSFDRTVLYVCIEYHI